MYTIQYLDNIVKKCLRLEARIEFCLIGNIKQNMTGVNLHPVYISKLN